MILTKDFVMLNFPKTGTTFARKVMKKLYKGQLEEHLISDKILASHPHGSIRQIPEQHRDKQIISVIRNPFSRCVSMYNYRSWTGRPQAPMEILLKEFPEYPEITFEQYLRMVDTFRKERRPIGKCDGENGSEKVIMGQFTTRFIDFIYENPEEVYEKVSSLGPVDPSFNEGISKIHFLHQESLTQDLVDFLSKQGFSDEELAFIHEMEWENVSKDGGKNGDYRKYYTNKSLIQKILKEEAFIFGLFPEYLKTVDLF